MRSATKISIDIRGEESIVALLERLPKLVVSEGGALDRAATKAPNIVARRQRQLAPDSKKTGSRDKQSKKTKAAWNVKLRTTIRTKIIRYPNGVWAVVGPKSPEGNTAHFMQEKPRRNVLWGKVTQIKQIRLERNWNVQAFEETKSEQLSAMEASLKQDIDANMRFG
jgi:hypothetical protein